jgi:hypothetical protein
MISEFSNHPPIFLTTHPPETTGNCNVVHPSKTGIWRVPQHGGHGGCGSLAGDGGIFYNAEHWERDIPGLRLEHGRPRRIWLVVGAASGGFHGKAEEVARDSASFAIS